jgi:HEAT repeat protein
MYNYLVAFVVALLVIVGTVFLCSGAINYTQDPVALGTTDWIEKLDDKDKNVRIEALIELGKSKDNLDQVVPAVVGQLGELDPLVSVAASQAMVSLGEPAVPHIKPFLESDDYKTYALGCIACREMGESCAVYVP